MFCEFAARALLRIPLGKPTALPRFPSWTWRSLLGGEGEELEKGEVGRKGRLRKGRKGRVAQKVCWVCLPEILLAQASLADYVPELRFILVHLRTARDISISVLKSDESVRFRFSWLAFHRDCARSAESGLSSARRRYRICQVYAHRRCNMVEMDPMVTFDQLVSSDIGLLLQATSNHRTAHYVARPDERRTVNVYDINNLTSVLNRSLSHSLDDNKVTRRTAK